MGKLIPPNTPLPSTGISVGQNRPLVERGDSVPTSPLSEQPLLQNDVDFEGSDLHEGSDLGGWTPVTRSTARTHRERTSSVGSNHTRVSTASNRENEKSMSTVERAEQNLSSVELDQLARRYQRMAETARAAETGYRVLKDQGNSPVIPGPNDRRVEFHPVDQSDNGADGSASDMLITVSPAIPSGEGPSREKGKGFDPRNWGDVSLLENFSLDDLKAQHDALANFAVVKEESVSTPADFFGDIPVWKSPTAEVPKVQAPPGDKAFVAPRPASLRAGKREGTHPTVLRPTASEISSKKKDEIKSGQTKDEIIAELTRQLNESRQRNSRSVEVVSTPGINQAKRTVQRNIAGLMSGGETARAVSVKPGRPAPARLAVGSTVHKAIREAGTVAAGPPPPSPPDGSSGSDHGSDSSASSDGEMSDVGRQTSAASWHRRMSSRRSSGKSSRMLLKPVPPTKYDGEVNTTAFQRFVRESARYVKTGRVPADEQVFYVSYYLKGKAADFYNQVVVDNEAAYDLELFFTDLFEFIFPQDFRIQQRKKLNRCFQNEKSVNEHIAEFNGIYSTIGLLNDQERVIKIWNSFRAEIQQEMYRDNLEPEVSTWAEVVKGAERAERICKLDPKKKTNNSPGSSQNQLGSKSNQERSAKSRGGGGRGRGRGRGGNSNSGSRTEVLRTSAVEVPSKKPKGAKDNSNRELSEKQRNEMLAKGLCFTCGEPGHLARNCPTTTTVNSKKKGKPPGLPANAATIPIASTSSSHGALYESTEVLESFHVGSIGLFETEVEEGGEPNGEPDELFERIWCNIDPLCKAMDALLEGDEDFDFQKNIPSDPVGDLYAQHAMLALHYAQPYPGEEPMDEDERFETERFGVHRLNETQHVIFDHRTDEDVLIYSYLLATPEFQMGLWYSKERCKIMGLDPDAFVPEERHLDILGDALVEGTKIALDRAHPDDENRFVTRGNEYDNVLISDRRLDLDLVLPKACLRDENFDLLHWYSHASRALSSDAQVWSSEVEPSLDEDKRCAQSEGGYSDMPSLRTVSDLPEESEPSDGESSFDEAPGIECLQSERTDYMTRVMLWERAIALEEQRARESALPPVADMLEFLQPYPGDEVVPWGDERCDLRRFKVERLRTGSYSIKDTFVAHEVILPMEYLRMPEFQLAQWFSCERALQLGITNYNRVSLPAIEIDDLLARGVEQYFSEISLELPSFAEITATRNVQGQGDSFTELIYTIGIPMGDHELSGQISESALMNPKLDLVGWVQKRKARFACAERWRLTSWQNSEQPNFFRRLFDIPDEPRGTELFCGGVQIPPDSMKGISRTASMPRVPQRIVARPVVIVVLVQGHPVTALVDSGSLGDLISTNIADQLKLKRDELDEPITLQLAVQGSRSKINHSVSVDYRYQDIQAKRTFFVANLSGYDMILGTSWLFQHKASLPPKFTLELLG
ncbi:CCHC-type domain-containing protein [Mycena venus]|uniref:CCHC-type domain-containing protein n=1 Tax=Mycena venus TaxID=2733690 RepID=A0A8H6Z3R0_9AGAR|nr:CCHC-type domain-containing protein [Mycena venus]